jgi:hypothetical protein
MSSLQINMHAWASIDMMVLHNGIHLNNRSAAAAEAF